MLLRPCVASQGQTQRIREGSCVARRHELFGCQHPHAYQRQREVSDSVGFEARHERKSRHTVGTFGMNSASYYWSRVNAAVGRLAQYVACHSSATWHVLVVDDFHLKDGGQDCRLPIPFFVLCAVAGLPLSCAKTGGVGTVTWVGFEMLHSTRQLGISQRRADWFMKWTSEVASSSTVHMRSFEECLCRVMYVAGALEYERPFLGPLYRFMSTYPRDSVQPVTAYVAFFLRHLSQ